MKFITGLMLMTPIYVVALPQSIDIENGKAHWQLDDTNTIINQETQFLEITLDNLDINTGQSLTFNQPNKNSLAVGHILGRQTQINGALTSNGNLFLINQHGFVFNDQARVKVSGLTLASGVFTYDQQNIVGNAAGEINLHGDIVAESSLQIIAQTINNTGNILVENGSLLMSGGGEYFINYDGFSYQIDRKNLMPTSMSNQGTLTTQNGVITLDAGLLSTSVVNQTGVISAQSINLNNGELVITSGDALLEGNISAQGLSVDAHRVAILGEIDSKGGDGGFDVSIFAKDIIDIQGSIDASATNYGDGGSIILFTPGSNLFRPQASLISLGGSVNGNGGFVDVSGLSHVEIMGAVDTSANNGLHGQFLIDPYDVTIDNIASANGSFTGTTFTPTANNAFVDITVLQNNLQNGDVTIRTDSDPASGGTQSGNITLLSDINLDGTNGNSLILEADGNLNIQARIQDNDKNTVDATDIVLIAGGDLVMDDAVIVDSSTGIIDIQATGDATITGLISNSTSPNAIYIHAVNVIDGGESNLDAQVTNTSGRISFIVEEHLGLDNAIDTQSALLVGSQSGAGFDFNLNYTGNVQINADGLTGNISLSGGDLSISDATGISTTGNVSLFVDDIMDTDRSININANQLIIELSNMADDLQISSNASALDLTANNNITLVSSVDTQLLDLNNDDYGANVQGDFNYRALNTNTSLLLTDNILASNFTVDMNSGNLVLNDNGVLIEGATEIVAGDLLDSDRNVTLNAAELELNLSAMAAGLAINTNAQTIGGQFSGALTINHIGDQVLITDINGDNVGLGVNQGNFELNANDVNLEGDVYALDQLVDGVNEGKIELNVGGQLTIGQQNNVDILSSTLEAYDGNGIQIAQVSDTSTIWRFGNQANNTQVNISSTNANVLVDVQGSNTQLPEQNLFSSTSNVTISANNSPVSENDGQVDVVESINSNLLAQTNRTVRINNPVVNNDIVLSDGEVTEILSQVEQPENEVATTNESINLDNTKSTQSDLQKSFSGFSKDCKPDDMDAACQQQNILQSFLGSLLIGGDLPDE